MTPPSFMRPKTVWGKWNYKDLRHGGSINEGIFWQPDWTKAYFIWSSSVMIPPSGGFSAGTACRFLGRRWTRPSLLSAVAASVLLPSALPAWSAGGAGRLFSSGLVTASCGADTASFPFVFFACHTNTDRVLSQWLNLDVLWSLFNGIYKIKSEKFSWWWKSKWFVKMRR